MKPGFLAASLAAAVVLALPAGAGAFRDAEMQLRDAYASYRTALFATNSGNAQATAGAMTAFEAKWTALSADWSAAPPPQYEDDAELAATLAAVGAVIGSASGQVAGGELPAAHETLEAIRDQIGDLHLRNGLFGFSDRMNAYHARMEEVLMRDYAALGDDALIELAGDAAVLAELAADIAAHPAPEAAQPEYTGLLADLLASVEALQAAVQAGDLDAAKAAIGKLKVPYAKLFVKFG